MSRIVSRGATFSEPGMRATLIRIWDITLPRIAFVGANPGKADGKIDDATARKYIGFATRWGFGSYVAGNLFQWVATDMTELIARIVAGLPVNPPDAASWLAAEMIGARPQCICLAWGNEPKQIARTWDRRAGEVRRLVRRLDVPIVCAARNRTGDPAHLSRLPYTAAPLSWT